MTRKQTQLTNVQWQRLLHHICVEVLALERAGRDVLDVCNARKEEGEEHQAANARIVVENGVPSLQYSGDADQQTVVSAIEEATESGSAAVSEASLLHELRKATVSTAEFADNKSWMAFDLRDPKMKLAVSSCNRYKTASFTDFL